MEGRNVNIGKTGIRTGEEENGEKRMGRMEEKGRQG